MNINVMLIDDDEECLESLETALRLNGFNVRAFLSPTEAIREYDPGTIDVVITDYHLPHMKGTALLKEIHQKKAGTPVIIFTGDPEKNLETFSLQAGACAFFRKPFDIKEIIAIIKELSGIRDKG
jgi:DNA-binding NtrC family response regulator